MDTYPKDEDQVVKAAEKSELLPGFSSLPYGELFDSPTNFLTYIAQLPKGEAETYGATPLNRPRTLEDQLELELTLRRRTYEIPKGISVELADQIQQTFAARFHSRGEANDENYQTSLSDGSDYLHILGVAELFEKGELGTASPAELLVIRKLKGIRSVELACLTHPYQIDGTLEEMRGAVKKSVEDLGGTYNENPEKIYKVKDVFKDRETGKVLGYLMTRKRVLGLMPDGTEIRERSSFVLQISHDSLVEQYGQEMAGALDNLDSISGLLGLDVIADVSLDLDMFGKAIPISSTIYAFSREDTEKINQRAAEKKKIEQEIFAKDYPFLYAWSQGETWPNDTGRTKAPQD